KRFTFGGEPPKDQRVYYINTKEMMDNKFGTPNPVPFRVVDSKVGFDMDVSIRCSGVYSYRIADPLLFYTKVCGNVQQAYTRDQIESQLKTEFISALQPTFAALSDLELRPNQIIQHNTEMEAAMNKALSEKWGNLRGLQVVSIALGSVTLPPEDSEMLKEAQRAAYLSRPDIAAGTMVGASAEAMKTAAGNSAGAMTGFMGMGMAMNAGGINTQNLFAMNQEYQAQQAAQQAQAQQAAATAAAAQQTSAAGEWKCPVCGAVGTGKFCTECGAPKPVVTGWTCSCGSVNKGKFCPNCGAKKPAEAPLYQCDKCGWQPEDPKNPPKFCPECGDPFNDGDIQ
ncbi:MAG: SPFH domain-containing protein, partial [Firmicutes bacterium]|nr:SPFH domain-containing protein [Bacillota bacterium]